MSNAVKLNVNGIVKLSTELSYEDLIWLYSDFIKKNDYVPNTSECLSINNLPQGRIIKKILKEENVTYNDFLNQFGKVSHVRTVDKSKYDEYVEKYISISNKIGHALSIKELINNDVGLPSSGWFIKYCPDKSVTKFSEFILWCGLKIDCIKKDKEFVIQRLLDKEKELQRPIKRSDICEDNIGFSMIVINRIWGGLNNCKKELGLMKTPTNPPMPFNKYKNNLDKSLEIIKAKINRNIISWKDIESVGLVEHKTITKAFKRENIDIFQYILEQGFMMNPSNFSFHYTFISGERVVSTYEYDFTTFINESGYIYNKDYQRDVMYKTFIDLDKKSKINCDYVFNDKYVEILGLIHNISDWRTTEYKNKHTYEYQQKMIRKEKLLIDNNKKFLFLFPEDFYNNGYKQKFLDFIND